MFALKTKLRYQFPTQAHQMEDWQLELLTYKELPDMIRVIMSRGFTYPPGNLRDMFNYDLDKEQAKTLRDLLDIFINGDK